MAADLATLRELYAFMRESGDVTHARCGELELRRELLPQPPRVPVFIAESSPSADDEAEDERRSLETLLHSSGVDADALMRAMGRTKAA